MELSAVTATISATSNFKKYLDGYLFMQNKISFEMQGILQSNITDMLNYMLKILQVNTSCIIIPHGTINILILQPTVKRNLFHEDKSVLLAD